MNDNIYDNFEQESLSNITDNLSQNNNKINFEDLHRRFNDKRENITESNSDKFVHQTHSSEPEKKNDKKQNFMDFENNNNILSNLQNEIKFDKFENNPMSNILNEFNNENNNQFNNENILMNNYNNYEFNRMNVKEKRDLDFNNGNNIINDNNNNFEFNRKNIPLNNNIEFESNIFDNNNEKILKENNNENLENIMFDNKKEFELKEEKNIKKEEEIKDNPSSLFENFGRRRRGNSASPNKKKKIIIPIKEIKKLLIKILNKIIIL